MTATTRQIDTVLFDLDDTLHDDRTAYQKAVRRIADEIAAERGIHGQQLYQAYVNEANGYWQKLSEEHLSISIDEARVQMWQNALATVTNTATVKLAQRCADSYKRYRLQYLVLSPGALDLVRTLRERGCKVGIVSNGFASTHHEKIDVLGLRPHIDGLFLADEMKMVKPNPEIFRHVCRTMGSIPERTAMVGDRYDRDVIGAIEVGLFTVLLDVHAIPTPEGGPQPDAIVPDITGVLAVLPLASG